jgi:bacillithiol system protein YtxJ
MAVINTIESMADLDSAFERSFEKPVIIFKHSNTCGISAHVFEMTSEIDADIDVIVIQEHRDLSNNVAARTGYVHQSPQAFVLKDGVPIYHATHYGIDPKKILEVISTNS